MAESQQPETSWHSYGKIYNLGHKETHPLFNGWVTIEEKIDGSQFSFGVINGALKVRSKGREFDLMAPDGIFKKACDTVLRLHGGGLLQEGWTYRGEVLASERHNTLKYGRVPAGNVIIFDIAYAEESYFPYADKARFAADLGLECVPLLHEGLIDDKSVLPDFLGRESVLGLAQIEGVVIKNYGRFDSMGKALMGKLVCENFREQHGKEWKVSNPSKGDILTQLSDRYTTEARWKKAIQRLRDDGLIAGEPRDIPNIIKEMQRDFDEECRDEVAQVLLDWAMPEIKRKLMRGFPEFYREQIKPSEPVGCP